MGKIDTNAHDRPLDRTGEVLVEARDVHKRFCRSLKQSLYYGLLGMAGEITGAFGDRADGAAKVGEPPPKLRSGEFWAVRDVSFQLRRGQCMALVGHNGAGKTTLLRMLNGLIKPDHGHIDIRGRVGALIALGTGFNPLLSGRENIFINGTILGYTRDEITSMVDRIIEFSELEDFIDAPVQTYSSGMSVRLGFAIASQLEPDVILIDEVLAVGDIGFRIKCYNRIFELVRNSAVIFVSHSMSQVGKICDSGLVMNGGAVVARSSNIAEVIAAYDDLFEPGAITQYGLGTVRLVEIGLGAEPAPGRRTFDPRGPSEVFTVAAGGSLHGSLLFETGRIEKPFQLKVNFFDLSAQLVAQCLLDPVPIDPSDGRTVRIDFAIDDLNLNAGRFAMGFAVMDANDGDGPQRFLMGLRDAVTLRVTGSSYVGVAAVQFRGRQTVSTT